MKNLNSTITCLLFSLCFGASISGFPRDTVLSLQNIHCQGCGDQAIKALNQGKLVQSAAFDKDKSEIRLRYEADNITVKDMLAAIEKAGYSVVPGAGKGYYKGAHKFDHKLDVKVISKNGENVELRDHLVPGKVTVFDFYADWCGPCREIDKAMGEYLKNEPALALRKINIVDWESPVSKAYMGKAAGLPYVVVYSKKGKKMKTISGLNLKLLEKTIKKGLK